MPDEPVSDPMFYSSEFRHGIDDKRRVSIPAKWRPAQADTEFMLILWPSGAAADANILVLPPAQAKALVKKISEMPAADPHAQSLRRLIGGKSAAAKLDKSGRMMLPEDMAKKAGLEKDTEAVLIGLVDRFEIWNPKRFEIVSQADSALLADAFKLV